MFTGRCWAQPGRRGHRVCSMYVEVGGRVVWLYTWEVVILI